MVCETVPQQLITSVYWYTVALGRWGGGNTTMACKGLLHAKGPGTFFMLEVYKEKRFKTWDIDMGKENCHLYI